MRRAFWRLSCWLRVSVFSTVMPVGMWRTRTPVSTLLTFCPPCPPERNVSHSMSDGLISMLIVSSTSGYTKTELKVVWRLPWELNGDMRTRRCTPDSALR